MPSPPENCSHQGIQTWNCEDHRALLRAKTVNRPSRVGLAAGSVDRPGRHWATDARPFST